MLSKSWLYLNLISMSAGCVAEGCVEQSAGSDEDKPPVHLRLLAQQDSETKEHAEGKHVVERNDQKSIRAGLVLLIGIKASHDDTKH